MPTGRQQKRRSAHETCFRPWLGSPDHEEPCRVGEIRLPMTGTASNLLRVVALRREMATHQASRHPCSRSLAILTVSAPTADHPRPTRRRRSDRCPVRRCSTRRADRRRALLARACRQAEVSGPLLSEHRWRDAASVGRRLRRAPCSRPRLVVRPGRRARERQLVGSDRVLVRRRSPAVARRDSRAGRRRDRHDDGRRVLQRTRSNPAVQRHHFFHTKCCNLETGPRRQACC